MAEREYIEIITSTRGEEKVDNLSKKIDDLGNEAKDTGKEVDNLGDKFKQTGTGTVSLKDKIKQLTEHFKALGQESNNSSVTLTNAIKKYVGIAAIGVGIKKATTVFTAFDDEIRKVQATSGATAEQMNNLRNQAKELGRTTRWSASEAAQAQFEFAKAGFEANEIYNATSGILNTATAGQLSLAEATEITAGTLRMFNLNASESQRVGDVLAMTANSSTTDIRGLGESLKYAGLGAHGFKMSLEETAAVLGVLGNRKIESSMAGTGLRAVFSTLKDKNKIKLLTDLDIQLTENGEYRNFLKIFDDIKKKTADMAPAQRESYLDQVFGREGGQVISALMETPKIEFDELLSKLNEAKGYSQKVAEVFDSGLGGSFKNLKSAVEGFSISLIENLAPTFITITNAVTRVINTFTTFFEWLNSGTLGANILSGAIVGLSAIYTAHVIKLKAVALWTLAHTAYEKSNTAQIIFGTGVKYASAVASGVLAVATKGLAIATRLLGGALSFLTAPVLLVIAAGVGLGAIFYDLYKRSETFRKGVQWLIGELKTLWGYIKKFTGLGIVIDVGKSVVNGVKDLFGFGKKKNKSLTDTAEQEVKNNKATTDKLPETSQIETGVNTDYLLLGSGTTTNETNNYKHNGYYLKGTKNLTNTSYANNKVSNNYDNSTLNNAVENYNSVSNNTAKNYNNTSQNDTTNNYKNNISTNEVVNNKNLSVNEAVNNYKNLEEITNNKNYTELMETKSFSETYSILNENNDNKNYSSNNIYSEYNTSENKIPEKTMEEKILEALVSIKDLLSSKKSDSSRVQINISKNDKEDIISQVVEDLTIALGNM